MNFVSTQFRTITKPKGCVSSASNHELLAGHCNCAFFLVCHLINVFLYQHLACDATQMLFLQATSNSPFFRCASIRRVPQRILSISLVYHRRRFEDERPFSVTILTVPGSLLRPPLLTSKNDDGEYLKSLKVVNPLLSHLLRRPVRHSMGKVLLPGHTGPIV